MFVRFGVVHWVVMSESEETKAQETIGRHGLPPATFEFLILSLRAQTEMQLGLFHFGDEADKTEPDFDLARQSSDKINELLVQGQGPFGYLEQHVHHAEAVPRQITVRTGSVLLVAATEHSHLQQHPRRHR